MLTWVFLAWQCSLLGQDTLFIQAVAQKDGKSIKIRWAPSHALLWEYANEVGYQVERVTIKDEKGKTLSPKDRLASARKWETVLPHPPESWRKMIDTSDIAGMGAAAIYGEGLTVNEVADHPILQTYQRSKSAQTLFGFGLLAADQDWQVAMAMGLALIDEYAESQKTYLYTIYPTQPPTSFVVEAANLVVKAIPPTALYAPTALQASFGDKRVHLEWDAAATPLFSSYWIEKSLDGGQQFVAVNRLPIIPSILQDPHQFLAFFRDTLLENFQRVVYRIRGKTVFGQLSPPSDTISGFGKPKRLEASLGIQRIEEIEQQALKITWDFPRQFNQHLEGFDVYRSQKKQGPFQQINSQSLKAMDRDFIDHAPYTSGYYKVEAKDIYGHSYASFSRLGQLEDSIPPAPPKGLQGTLDKDGMISLNWAPSPEGDVMGYRVFRSNQPEGYYNQVTSYFTRDTFYSHKVDMNTTTRSIFYKVIALDYRENYSEKSSFCEIRRPDLIPPIPPVMRQALPKKDGILLSWKSSSSRDVAKHQLQRKKIQDEDWTIIFSWLAGEKYAHYQDSNLSLQQEYDYRILAVDSSGLESSSKTITISQLDKGKRSLIENFQVALVPDQTDIRLQWMYPSDPNLFQFVIYRSIEGGPLSTLHTIRLDQASAEDAYQQARFRSYQYNDTKVKHQKTYQYQVIAKHKDGGQSPLSPTRSIQIK